MAWCHWATSHYLSQCWPRSMLPYGISKPQGVKHSKRKHNRIMCIFHGINLYLWLNGIWIEFKIFSFKKSIWKYHMQNVSHFILATVQSREVKDWMYIYICIYIYIHSIFHLSWLHCGQNKMADILHMIYIFIPCSVLILASDWLTTMKYGAVSHVWRHQREI